MEMHTRPFRIAVVDDEALVLEGLCSLLRKSPVFELVAAATEHREALGQLAGQAADVALLDICTGDGADLWAGVGLWQKEAPNVRLIVLDDMVRDVHLRRVLRLGLHGYVAKRDTFGEIAEVLKAAGRGEQTFSPTARRRLAATPLGWEMRTGPDTPGLHSLTIRETEILSCLAQGLTARACAAVLKISPSTVENHKARIMKKLKIHRMIDLARFAMREGLIPH